MAETYFIIPESQHNALVEAVYRGRGFLADEAAEGARLCAEASRHGIRTHNAIKALHLDHLFGSGSKGCVPGAQIEEIPTRFAAAKAWNANRKLGQSTAYRAMDAAIALAERYGVGTVSVDNAFHYLWGGGYVMDAAKRGYIAYTNCTAALAEVVPFGGKFPTLGTNPHSWGFPTTRGGRLSGRHRLGHLRDRDGPRPAAEARGPSPSAERRARPQRETRRSDPHQAASLLPFGAHKGYGLVAHRRDRRRLHRGLAPHPAQPLGHGARGEAHVRLLLPGRSIPDAISGGAFAKGRSQAANVKAVMADILGHGNEACLLPGQLEARWAKRTSDAGGLLFTQAEVDAFNELAEEAGVQRWRVSHSASVTA